MTEYFFASDHTFQQKYFAHVMHDRIDFSDFRQLLQSLENSDIQIRFRVLGEPWIGLSKLILLSDSAMIIQCEDGRKVILNLKNVVEFQLEKKFSTFEANTAYEIGY